MSKPTAISVALPARGKVEHYEALTLEASEVTALAVLLAELEYAKDADLDKVLPGVAVLSRVIGDKMTTIGAHAEALLGANRAAE